jgi:hypothetical protein
MYNNSMAAARNLYLALSLMGFAKNHGARHVKVFASNHKYATFRTSMR